MIRNPCWALALFVALSVVRSTAATVALSPVADTSLFQERPNNNLGAMAFMPVGLTGESTRGRGLIRFDLGQIPSNAVVSSATLRISATFGNGGTRTYDIHRMLQSWIEGTKNFGPDEEGNLGQAATSGEPTWNNRRHGISPWGVAGGAAGSDYVATATAFVTSLGAGNRTFSSATLTADVQQWVANSGTNFGWMLKDRTESSAGTAWRIGAREDAVNTPLLTVTYTVPTNPALVITNDSPLRFGTISNDYTQTLQATGGVPPYAWSLAAGALPPGISLGVNGVLNGIPTNTGTFDFTARVTDGVMVSTTKVFSVNIDPVLVIGSVALANNQIEIRFLAQTNRSYVVEHRAVVHTGTWNPLTNISIAGTQSVTAHDGTAQPTRFYRVRKN